MTVQTLQSFFMWCSIINLAWMLLISLICITAADRIYRLHSRWFPLSRGAFNTILYSFLGVFKILVIVFNVVPWIALSIIG